ncbi:MAG: copper amine oxidase domain protein [Eubacterium sp.]|nr:copper amine oxidase domain protein [Eubacterium sp.]
MKKISAFFSFVLCFVIFSAGAFAADTPIEDKNSTQISVSFKTGTGTYTVNGKTVKAEASIQTGGKTFVPVKVITDALGASLTVDLKAKTAIINYNNVEIKLTDKKKEALIAGKKVSIDAAPYIKNNSFMATITFLADTLGADISTSNGTVTFLKEIANPNSIKDFSTLIKKTKKGKIGDSYYKWSMQLPEDLKLEYRDFNGSENIFVDQNESYLVSIYLLDAGKDTNLDNIANNIKESLKEYTLIDFIQDTHNGVDYVEFMYKDDKWTEQERVYIAKNKVYFMTIYTKNEDSYDDEKYKNLMDSFSFYFDKGGSTEDLSDVTAEGYRKYQDTRLKWSIDMIPYWEEFKDNKIQNKVVFNGKDDEYLSVEVYSLEKDETLDSITQKSIDKDKEELNPSLYTITNSENTTIGDVDCTKVYYTLKMPSKVIYGCEIFIVDGNYKYLISSEIPEDVYKNSKEKELFDGMLNSFSFKKLDAKSTGKLLDPDKVTISSDKTSTVNTDLYSVEVPFNWIEGENNTDTYKYYYKGGLSVGVGVYDVNSISQFIRFLDDEFAKKAGKDFKLESKVTLSEKGTTCYKYVITYMQDGYEYKEEMYVIQKGNKSYVVDLISENLFYSTKTINTFNKIWQSFTLK